MDRPTGHRGAIVEYAKRLDPACGLKIEIDGPVVSLLLDRPERHNALDRILSHSLLDGLIRAGADTGIRAVLLAGSDRQFCAGDDVEGVERWRHGSREHAPFDPTTHDADYLRICEAMIRMPKPVVVALAGSTAGAGTEIACAADYRLAAPDARVGSRLLQVGHVGSVVLMSRLVGLGHATRLYLSGRMVGAEEAQRIGLIDEVVKAGSVVLAGQRLAAELADLPTAAIGLFKELRERTWGQPVEAGLRLQDHYHLRTHDEVEDSSEGMEAFLQRRAPRFEGR